MSKIKANPDSLENKEVSKRQKVTEKEKHCGWEKRKTSPRVTRKRKKKAGMKGGSQGRGKKKSQPQIPRCLLGKRELKSLKKKKGHLALKDSMGSQKPPKGTSHNRHEDG